MGEQDGNAHLVFVCEMWKSESLPPLAAMATGLKVIDKRKLSRNGCVESAAERFQSNLETAV